MSKIAISPNVNGNGTFTIAAPNSNTDRTLTLPDAGGEVLTNASNIAAAKLTGALPALDGSALTNLPSSAAPTTAQVLSATAGASAGAIGTYAFLRQTQKLNRTAGTLVAGSALRFNSHEARTGGFTGHATFQGTVAPAGTWMMLGQVVHVYGEADAKAATLFMRVS